MKKTIYSILIYIISFSGFGQMSGNAVYGSSNYYKENQNQRGFNLTDSNLSFTVKVMMSKKADAFTIIFGLNEESETVESCNSKINKRINDFINSLGKIGIKKQDTYSDFISQNKIYDYSVTNNKAEQFEKGFEIKKNIIISVNSLKNIDSIIETASEFKIYDVIKIDYLSTTSNEVYDNLFQEALKIAETKKDRYLKSFNKRSVGNPTATDNFDMITPESQYKNYKAFESSELESYSGSSNSLVKKLARKNSTFYYDGISQSGIDKIIDNASPEIGIQYVLTLTISYKIDTSL